jgi:tripartite-type tricarboxylate transporter receptor subunit TctC
MYPGFQHRETNDMRMHALSRSPLAIRAVADGPINHFQTNKKETTMFQSMYFRKLAMPIAGIALALFAQVSHAQTDWPKRPVTIVVGFTAGGTTDIVSRMLANELSKIWGQTILIDNRPGAGGNIAGSNVAKANPDGYTLFMGSSAPLASNPALYKSMPYNTLRDFTPITLVADVPNMLVVNPRAMPVASFKEFITLVKANPGKYFYGSTGSGTASHLSAELFKVQTGTEITHVPYKGSAALNDLLSGDSVHFMFATIPSTIQHVRNGKLRALAVTSLKRSPGVPDLPTVAESGFPGFDAGSWYGLVGPAGMPREIVIKIQQDVVRVLKTKEMHDKFIVQGADPVGSTPEQFAEYIRSELAKWEKIAKLSGATVE